MFRGSLLCASMLLLSGYRELHGGAPPHVFRGHTHLACWHRYTSHVSVPNSCFTALAPAFLLQTASMAGSSTKFKSPQVNHHLLSGAFLSMLHGCAHHPLSPQYSLSLHPVCFFCGTLCLQMINLLILCLPRNPDS